MVTSVPWSIALFIYLFLLTENLNMSKLPLDTDLKAVTSVDLGLQATSSESEEKATVGRVVS